MKKILSTLALSLIFAIAMSVTLRYSNKFLVEWLEYVTYDWRYRLKCHGIAEEKASGLEAFPRSRVQAETFPDYGIHIVDIDDRSMVKLGSYWSWDRGYQAKMLDSLSTRFPAAIAFDVLFYEPEDEKRYARLAQTLDSAVSGDSALEKYRVRLSERLATAVDYDARFSKAIAKSGRVTLGFSFSEESDYKDLTSQTTRHRMSMEWHDSLRPASALVFPDSILSSITVTKTIIDGIYPENAHVAKQIGHINAIDAASPSVIRATPLLYRFAKFPPVYLPMSVRVAADLFATPNEEIVYKPGKYIDIGKPFKIFKDAEGKASFSYPDFTEAQYRLIVADRDGILSTGEGEKRRVTSYLAVFRDVSGKLGLETRGGKASPEMLSALSAAFARDGSGVNTDSAPAVGLDKMAVDGELGIGDGFTVRRDSDNEWEVFSDDESVWLTALDVRTLSSLTPDDFVLPPGVDRKLITFDFWVKREKGVLTSSIPVLRALVLDEMLAGSADEVLSSIPHGSRRDFGAPARIPLLGNGQHIVTYFGPKAKPFPYFSFYDVMENKVNYPMEGNVFIVGSTSPSLFDIKAAPHERVFPAVEIHASILNSILTGTYVRRLSEWQNLMVMLAVGLFAALLGFLAKPLLGGFLAGASLFAYTFVAFRLFDSSFIWIEMVGPMVTVALTFTAVTVYRHMTEEKNRKFLQSTFKQYLSPELIDMMYTQKQRPQLGGDEGIRTAYFTDIEGFSTFSEKLGSPTRLVELLNEYLSAMTDILLERYGTLDKYEGDAIIAFFGAPVAMPDHAAQACHTALDMQKKLGELREKWRAEGEKWPPIVHAMRMRIGINTGAITTGNMGSAVRMNYTMMGDAVNLAARLESAAKNYGVHTMVSNYTYDAVIDGNSRDRVSDLFEMRKLDVITVVGKSEPVTVYELICRKGELTGEAAGLLEIYGRGIDRYYGERDFRGALDCFEKAAALEPNRNINPEKPTPSGRFADMCRRYIDNPPGADWDGVNRLTSK